MHISCRESRRRKLNGSEGDEVQYDVSGNVSTNNIETIVTSPVQGTLLYRETTSKQHQTYQLLYAHLFHGACTCRCFHRLLKTSLAELQRTAARGGIRQHKTRQAETELQRFIHKFLNNWVVEHKNETVYTVTFTHIH